MERDELVSVYYQFGFQQKEILFCLAQRHGIILSSRTLKRVLKRHRLYRKKHRSDLLEVAFFIEKELIENVVNYLDIDGCTINVYRADSWSAKKTFAYCYTS